MFPQKTWSWIVFVVFMTDLTGLLTERVNPGEYPYVVRIEAKRDSSLLCAATLMSPSQAVTCAGCITIWNDFISEEDNVWRLRPCEEYAIHAGNIHLDKVESTSQLKDIDFWWAHPRYKMSMTGIAKNDLALIQVNGTFEINDFVRTLSIPYSFPTELFRKTVNFHAKKCLVLGWLRKNTCNNTIFDTNVLQVNKVQIVKNDDCSKRICDNYNVRLCNLDINKLGFICADVQNRADCLLDGDTGGPMVCDGRLSGFSSWVPKYENNDKFPALFTNLEALYEMEHQDFYFAKTSNTRAIDTLLLITLSFHYL